MAIFKDDNDQHYLGILYNKTADIYSGNFMKVSARGFKLMLAFQWALKRFFFLCIALMFSLFLYKKILEPSKDFEQLFLAIGITVTIFLCHLS